MNDLNENNLMPRPRVEKLFDQATRGKLVYVIAGAGYGKTWAVRNFIEQQEDAIVRWMQLTENDNIGSHYWETLTHNISFDNPDLAGRLREFGFPETPARFKQFAGILKSDEHRSLKTFLVLDDFHMIHSEQALAFAERCAHLHIPGACVIIISRTEPQINVVSLFAKGQAHVITEDELRFTDIEILDYLKQRGLSVFAKDLPELIEATKGWALAIQLLTLTLKRQPANLGFALDTVRQNIFKLMEMEAFNDFPENTKKMMVKLSLISNLPTTVLQKLFEGASFFQGAPQLASFVWFDSLTGEYRVHPLYWEFLQSKQDILSEEEKQDTYRQAALWCSRNSFNMDAVYFYAKLLDFEKMLEIFLSYPFRLPHDTCEYFLEVLESICSQLDDEKKKDVNVLLLRYLFCPLLLMGAGRYKEAEKRNFDAIRECEDLGLPVSLNLIYTAYNNLAYINFHTCTATHKYDFYKYLKKSIEYFRKSTIPPLEISGAFAVPDIRSYACLVGEGADISEFNKFQEIVDKTSGYIAETSHYMYYGYDDLLSCELAFFRNRMDDSRFHAHRAILNAREKKQYSVEMMAAGYLLRIALHEGDPSLAKELLKQMQSSLENPSFWNRQLLFDLYTGFFYIQIGLPQMAPPWLSMEEGEATSEVHVPARELIVRVKYHIAQKKYKLALVVLNNSYPREPQERFLLGELALSLLSAIARAKTGDAAGAMADFERAYALSFDGELEMFYIEQGNDLRPLITLASKQEQHKIPKEWLKAIGRKASAYAKKAAVIGDSIKDVKNIRDSIQLSEREREILNDLYHGLSREEIAEYRYLSVNTIKKILQSLYIKLDANNNVDAIRIAIEKNLI